MVVLAVLLAPALVGGLVGYALVGWLGVAAGAPAGFALGLAATAGVLTPWVTRAVLDQEGIRLRGSRWRGGFEVWDLRAREVTVVSGLLRRRATVRRVDRRETPPAAPRRPPRIPGLWPLEPEQRDAPQIQRALARARRWRARAVSVGDDRSRRGR